jgi:hypothetical protein
MKFGQQEQELVVVSGSKELPRLCFFMRRNLAISDEDGIVPEK